MDIRFMVKDVNGEEHGWRIQSDRMSFALSRFLGIAGEDTKTPGEERWGHTTYPSTFAGAIYGMLQAGMMTFPGEFVDICATMQELQQEVLRVLAPLEDVQTVMKQVEVSTQKVDKALKVLKTGEKMPAKKVTEEIEEEEDANEFSLDEDDDGELSFD